MQSSNIVSVISFGYLVSFGVAYPSSSSIESTHLSVTLFFERRDEGRDTTFHSLSPTFVTTAVTLLVSSVLLVLRSSLWFGVLRVIAVVRGDKLLLVRGVGFDE